MRERRTMVGAMAAAMVLAACGSDAGTASTTTSTTAGTISTASVTTTTVEPTISMGPAPYATAFVEAWASGDRTTAELLGSPDAVDTIFSREGGGSWVLSECEGAAGSSYCTFTAGGDPTVIVRVMNEAAQLAQPHAVAEVRFEG